MITLNARLEQWKKTGVISAEQYAQLSALARNEPFSLFLELHVLLYAGVLAFVAGLGWTIARWSQEMGDLLILTILASLVATCFGYCYSRSLPWSRTEVASPNLIFDYVLYLGCLAWSVALGYLEQRFHLLRGQWDLYLLVSAGLFFFLAYRFDNRMVLSLALSSLAGWFGLTVSHGPLHPNSSYRGYALVYGILVAAMGALLERARFKPHFFGTYLNIAANVLFWALLWGVFDAGSRDLWFVALLLACVVSLTWGLSRRQFAFVAYAAVYGYLGLSSLVLRTAMDGTGMLVYFLVTGTAMVAGLVVIARRFGREA